MKRTLIAVTILLLAAPAAFAQRIDIDLPGLAAKAAETVDITLDGAMLRLASKFLSDDDADERAIRAIVGKLQGIYVRSYEFDRDGAYDRSVLDKIRAQLGANWKPIVNVRSRSRDDVAIYADARGEAIVGLVILAAEPRELTVVNIVGPIDLEKLSSIEGQFGIPRVTTREKRERDDD